MMSYIGILNVMVDWIYAYNELPNYMNWIVEKKLKRSKFVSETIIESLNKLRMN